MTATIGYLAMFALQSVDLGLYQQKISDARQLIDRAMQLLAELTVG
jgi:hypothetical protein